MHQTFALIRSPYLFLMQEAYELSLRFPLPTSSMLHFIHPCSSNFIHPCSGNSPLTINQWFFGLYFCSLAIISSTLLVPQFMGILILTNQCMYIMVCWSRYLHSTSLSCPFFHNSQINRERMALYMYLNFFRDGSFHCLYINYIHNFWASEVVRNRWNIVFCT